MVAASSAEMVTVLTRPDSTAAGGPPLPERSAPRSCPGQPADPVFGKAVFSAPGVFLPAQLLLGGFELLLRLGDALSRFLLGRCEVRQPVVQLAQFGA